jgi:transcription elongation factor Elf1
VGSRPRPLDLEPDAIQLRGDVALGLIVVARLASRILLGCAEPIVLAKETSRLAPAGFTRFEILASDGDAEKTASVLPDLATCPKCLAELFDSKNRRHGYPFTNCTECGPRYSIILDIPYDRPRTTMREFELCPKCLREYTDPADRRFHAQPNACPVCGPRLSIEIADAARAIDAGCILALKGIGGFQLLVDARNENAVARLRRASQGADRQPSRSLGIGPGIRAASRLAVHGAQLKSIDKWLYLPHQLGHFVGRVTDAGN